jgi:hypothetical protein
MDFCNDVMDNIVEGLVQNLFRLFLYQVWTSWVGSKWLYLTKSANEPAEQTREGVSDVFGTSPAIIAKAVSLPSLFKVPIST